MPSLDFKEKQFVYTHHLTVPFRELVVDAKKSLPAEKGKPSMDDNLIIQGDNLHALKALLPRYAGKVKCIYIDPPYNTGNEGWCYNDNVRSPLMKEWVERGNPVDGDDMERHDKWLSMMWPRLHLLRELLSEDGIILVSIDDNEHHRLRALMEEVLGEKNYLNTFCWVNNLKGRQIAGAGAARTYENVITYAKNIEQIKPFEISVEAAKALMPTAYKGFEYETETDEDGSFVVKNELYNTNSAFNEETRPNLVFNIHYNFKSREVKFSNVGQKISFAGFDRIPPRRNNDGVHRYHAWRWSRQKIGKDIADLKFAKTENGAKVFTKVRGHERTVLKDMITDISTTRGSSDVGSLFEDRVFEYPKPVDLIKILINRVGREGIVLDSFAGSGSTAQAVLELNRADDGNRKFILIECEDYANNITAERVRRVIRSVPRERDEQGLGSSFTYCTLGQELNVETLLKADKLPDFATLARYVFYTATGQTLEKVAKPGKDFFVGETDVYRVYLVYKPDREFLRSGASALNSDLVERIAAGNKSKKKALVFATAKFMGQRELSEQGIEFAQLPYAIYRVLGD